MLLLISPAKSLDLTSRELPQHSLPRFLERSSRLVERLREYDAEALQRLMDISPDLAELNAARFADWRLPFTPQNAKAALFLFSGDVYTGLKAQDFSPEDLAFAQRHLRILSGLYGLLRPLDLIAPYRLEMGTALPVGEAKNLYAFWEDALTPLLVDDLHAQGDNVLVNLASQEYFKAVVPAMLPDTRIISISFKELRNDAYKIISFSAKKARGAMARYAIVERIHEPEQLKSFSDDGYAFNAALSSENDWLFTR